jgi:DNA-binding IclR family transcriptional regulator
MDGGTLGDQARIFEAVAGNSMLTGPLHDLARQFDVTPSDFLDCLAGLVRAGWVTVKTDPEGLFSIQLEP